MSQEQLLNQKQPFFKVPLTPEEIDKARDMIKDSHELVDTPIYKVFPILKPVARIMGKDVDAKTGSESEHLLHDNETGKKKDKKKKKQAKKEEEGQEPDPLNYLGFGMVAYRDLMFTMFALFAVLTVIMIPVITFYNAQGGISDLNKKNWTGPLSLGSFGYSTSECQQVPFTLNSLPIVCPYGTLGSIVSAGVIPEGTTGQDLFLCNWETASAEMKTKCPISTTLVSEMNSQLVNVAERSASNKFNYRTVNSNGVETSQSLFESHKTIDPSCNNINAKVFVQFQCHMTSEQLETKKSQAAMISSAAVLVVLVYLTVLFYFKRASHLNQMQWDIETITPGDYTAEMEITDKQYAFFINNIFPREQQKRQDISIGEALKSYIKKELERVLTEKLGELKSTGKSDNLKIHEVKIADIVFAFNNARLINLLRIRGGHIVFQRYDKMREVEAQINTLKNEEYDSLTKPVHAFITFEEEDGLIVAQEFEAQYDLLGRKKPADKEFMDDEMCLEESTEPTNIIWENRHWTPADYAKRTLQVVAIIAGLLAVSFLAIYSCKSYAIELAARQPNVNPQYILEHVVGNSAKVLHEFAVNEHENFYGKLSRGEDPIPMSGFYRTYCLLKQKGSEALADYPTELCDDFNASIFEGLFFNQVVTIGIVAINFILRMFIIKLIIFIGKDTESEQTRLISNGVFIVQFFNTALLLLLVNANMSEQGGFFDILSKQSGIPDFNSTWFNEIGTTLVGAMLFNIYWPVVEFFIFGGMRQAFRLLDRSFSCDQNRTKKTTLQQYVELYSGPVFFIHYKYSSIMNITFVTMMYGLGMPVLFPVASMSYLTLYCMEKIMLHYCYREPPMYDERLNNNALGILTWAPLLFLSFGYWMLSSKQLLANVPTVLTYTNIDRTSGHYVGDVFTGEAFSFSNVASPLLITFWILLIFIAFRGIIYRVITFVLPFLAIGDFEIDEDLDNYFNTIDENDRNWSIKEEENARAELGMHIIDDYTLNRFKNTTMGESHMKGTHCYDILANEQYLDDFQYFSPARENRNEFIKDDDEDEGNDAAQSDLVKMILNLAFLPKDRAEQFSFDKKACGAPAGSFKVNPHAIN